jgi:CDP-paratose 2-epimerase
MKYLITGGLGFIGSNMADRLLRDGADVVILDNQSRKGVHFNLEWLRRVHGDRFELISGDIRDYATVERAMQGVGTVFHFAAQVAVTTSVDDPMTDFTVNALGTVNVLEAARKASPMPAVLFTSTNKVYGGLESVEIVEGERRYEMANLPMGVPESFPIDFHSPYGCSKGAADQYVRDYHRVYGLPTVVFRMSCIYGPRQFGNEDQGWLAHFVLTSMRGGDISIFGDGKQVRDLLFVEDLVEAFLAARRNIGTVAGTIFNIGGGPANAISVWTEFRELLQAATGKVPTATLHDWRVGDQRSYISDIRRAQSVLGWTPKISPKEGIARLAEWGKEAIALAK